MWVSSCHATLALGTGLVCGAVFSRVAGGILLPYAAILGTILVYRR
jgi:hypothetical protein